jgi:hypothetical protein
LKHEVFAMRSVFECVPQGMKFYHLRMPPIYVACLRTYPKANSKAVAWVDASRLMRRREVQAPFWMTFREAMPGDSTG